MSTLTHYIVVRSDLPLGVAMAMVAHAAGESAHQYRDENGRFTGATVVVLEAKNEAHLEKIERKLMRAGIVYQVVYESAQPYKDQFMAIGLVPIERDKVEGVMREYQLLRRLDPQDDEADVCDCDLCTGKAW